MGLFGPFSNADIAMHRRVVETNLFGAMNGAAAVLPYFMEQEEGVLITNISMGGFAPVPFAAAYTAGKFGLRGFMAALRQELAPMRGIHICSLFPAVIDTPGFEHGANVSGRRLKPGWPVFPPERVGEAMVALALRPRDEVSVGWPARLAKAGYGLAPLTTERLTGKFFRTYLRRAEPAGRVTGNLFAASTGSHAPHGGWREDGKTKSPRETVGRTLAWAGAAGIGIACAVALAIRERR